MLKKSWLSTLFYGVTEHELSKQKPTQGNGKFFTKESNHATQQ